VPSVAIPLGRYPVDLEVASLNSARYNKVLRPEAADNADAGENDKQGHDENAQR
jgi:hypothetical protein